MLPLSSESFPSTSGELAEAIGRGFAEQGLETQSVRAEGGEFPQIDSLALDLSDASASRKLRPPPTNEAPGVTGVKVHEFEIRAQPLYFEKTPFDLQLKATEAGFFLAGDPKLGALVLREARDGRVSISVANEDLEAMVHRFVVEAAEKQGVEVHETHLELKTRGPRSLSFHAEVTAKMFFMTTTLTIDGQIDVDADLNARLSHLTLSGDGMMTKLATGFLRPKLDLLERRVIPLLAFSLGELRLRDIEVSTGKRLLIRAEFGSH